MLIYAQRPQATLVADYDTWKKVDRYVMRGSKGIAIFPSRALSPHLRYVFDIKDTGGRARNLTWDLKGNTLKEFEEVFLCGMTLKELKKKLIEKFLYTDECRDCDATTDWETGFVVWFSTYDPTQV